MEKERKNEYRDMGSLTKDQLVRGTGQGCNGLCVYTEENCAWIGSLNDICLLL